MKRSHVILTTVLLSAGHHASARVYKTLPSEPATRPADTLRWNLAQHSRMEINGALAEVRTWSSRENPTRTLATLTHYYENAGMKCLPLSGAEIGWLEARDGAMVLRYLIVPGQGDDTLITQITRSASSVEADTPPRDHRLTELPVFPASTPVSCLKDLDKGTTTETSRVNSSLNNVRDFMVNGLSQSGWTTPIPTASDTGLWLRGKEIASFSTYEDANGDRFLIRMYRQRN